MQLDFFYISTDSDHRTNAQYQNDCLSHNSKLNNYYIYVIM